MVAKIQLKHELRRGLEPFKAKRARRSTSELSVERTHPATLSIRFWKSQHGQ